MSLTIWCATTNKGKLREFERASSDAVEFRGLPGLQAIPVPEETGSTFEENARLKALYYSAYADGLLLAEDSGLEVDALGGAPGVYSARFARPHADDEANNDLLLQRLGEQETRSGRYVCAIALARGNEILGTFLGTVEGQILRERRGTEGFGYDPLFFYPPFGATFAEVSPEQKQTVSHRGAAIDKLCKFLTLHLETELQV